MAPAFDRCIASCGLIGGFSPGRTLGPVVGTVGLVRGVDTGVTGGVLTGVVAEDPTLALGDGSGDEPLVHPASATAIRAIVATSRSRTPQILARR